jgi:membrane-associated phospholipid phosphatase
MVNGAKRGPTPKRSSELRRVGLLTLLFGCAFVVLTAVYRTGATKGVDRAVQLWLRTVHTPWLDALGRADDFLFRATPAFAAALLLVLVLWRFGPRWSWCAPLGIAATVLADAIVRNGWSQVMHPRALLAGIGAIFGGSYHASGSFPSSHVSRAIFLAVIALAFLPRKISIPITLIALSTLFARTYTESHKLIDVLGGTALGAFVACFAVWGVGQVAAIDPDFRGMWRSARAAVARRGSPRSVT